MKITVADFLVPIGASVFKFCVHCNTVERSIKTYNGQIHRLPYIATINNFPWAALPNDSK